MKFPITYQLTTARCRLRHISRNDFPYVFEASQVEGFTDGMLWEPHQTIDELEEPFERGCRSWQEETAFLFTIESKEDAAFLGRISIRAREEAGVWNFGFWTHPNHQGKGYMTEVVERVIRFGFEELEAQSIDACHAVWNIASRKVMERAGMVQVSSCDRGYQKKGQWIAQHTLEITRSLWLQNQS